MTTRMPSHGRPYREGRLGLPGLAPCTGFGDGEMSLDSVLRQHRLAHWRRNMAQNQNQQQNQNPQNKPGQQDQQVPGRQQQPAQQPGQNQPQSPRQPDQQR